MSENPPFATRHPRQRKFSVQKYYKKLKYARKMLFFCIFFVKVLFKSK